MHADTTLPAARRVEQSALYTDLLFGEVCLLVDVKLHGERFVWIHAREGEQVGGSDEEVAMECGDAKAACTSDAHDGFPASFPG